MANEAVEMEPSGRVLPIFRGEYDAGRTYENPDIVLYRNSSYVAKQVTVGNPPPAHALADDYWQMVARGIIDADVSDSTIEFTEASERSNIKSGEKSNIIMGKIMKFFTDLKDIAFSGRYSDLIDAPVSLKNPKALTFTGAVTGSYDGSTAKSVAIPSVGNGTLTIQKNGTNIKTFTANQTGNVTANITVPTSASDVSAVPASKVLTTAEQINANTNSANVAGATAVKAMVNQINSNIGIHLKWIGICPNNNADNAISMGVYATNPTTESVGDWGILIVFTNGDANYDRWVFQFWLSTKGAINRRYNINSEGWTTWAEL